MNRREETTTSYETMTDETTTNDEIATDYRRTLGEMSHTNPYTGEVFGNTETYTRGRVVAADGGKANAVDRTQQDVDVNSSGGDATCPETLSDVSHTPSGEVDGAQRCYDRGVRHE